MVISNHKAFRCRPTFSSLPFTKENLAEDTKTSKKDSKDSRGGGDDLRGRAIHQSILQLGGSQVESNDGYHSNEIDASHTEKSTRVCVVHQAKNSYYSRLSRKEGSCVHSCNLQRINENISVTEYGTYNVHTEKWSFPSAETGDGSLPNLILLVSICISVCIFDT